MNEALWRLKLTTWLSPAFPVGGFAFSGGLEWAVEAGDVTDADRLVAWLDDVVRYGSARADAVLLAAAWRNPDRLASINALALALAPCAERRLETAAQGTAFLAAVMAAWPVVELGQIRIAIGDGDIAYSVAVAVAARSHDVPLRPTLESFALAGIAGLVSAALRLGVVGQNQAQTVIAAMTPRIADLASWAVATTLDDLGTSTWFADIAAMRHETQYSRLFRS